MGSRAAAPTARVLALLMTLLLLSACADPGVVSAGAHGKPPKVRTDPKVRALVPKELRDRGRLVLATSAPYEPMEFFKNDNETLTGFDIDLGTAVGAAMGLRTKWRNTSFDSVIPGLRAGKYDGGMSGYSITHERLGSTDMVSYYLSGGGFLVKKGSGVRAGSFGALCGYRVAVKKGVSQAAALAQASKRCTAGGKQPIRILQIPDQNVVVLTMLSGRADVVAADKPQVEHAAEQSHGKLCVSSTYRTSHSIAGIAVPKGHKRLLRALRAAVDSLVDSGDYARIARRWGTGVPEKGAPPSADFKKLLAPWGVGQDGTISKSKVFTDPRQISGKDHYFHQPVRKGCV